MPPSRYNSTESQPENVSRNTRHETFNGFEAEFDPCLDKKYVCPVCLAALRNPVQTKCGHRFCKACILRACNGSRQQGKCPIDKLTFDVRTELFEDVAFKREILSLTVLCGNKEDGCVWNGELRELEDHGNLCLYAIEVCANNGCEKKFVRKDSVSHQSECLLRFMNCMHCQEQVIFKDLTQHHLNICKRYPVDCSQCGKTGLLREQLSSHLDATDGDCTEIIVPCVFQGIGCNELVLRRNMAVHKEEAAGLHLHLMFTYITELKSLLTGQEAVLRETQETCNQLICEQADLARQLMEKNEQLSIQGDQIAELKATSYTGELHWKVALPAQNYSTPILSPVFYTSCPGYKFQLCLELRGHVARNETHVSLYVMLCHGDHDEQVFFPFNGSCKVTLFNQSHRGGHSSSASEENENRNHVTSIGCFNIPRVETASSQNQKEGACAT